VLRIVGGTLAREVGEAAFVARYGGEEFVVAFPGLSTDAALARAQALCVIVEGLAFHASGRPVKVTMSGGIASFGFATESGGSVFDRADRALYAAKREGRNRCVVL
jgi:diguanylate cyclase